MIEIQPNPSSEYEFDDFKSFLQKIIASRNLLQELYNLIYEPPEGQEAYEIGDNRNLCSILIEFYFSRHNYNKEDIFHLLNIYINRWYDALNPEQRNEVNNLLNQIRERLNQSEHHS